MTMRTKLLCDTGRRVEVECEFDYDGKQTQVYDVRRVNPHTGRCDGEDIINSLTSDELASLNVEACEREGERRYIALTRTWY
jgi:hypothetical protein